MPLGHRGPAPLTGPGSGVPGTKGPAAFPECPGKAAGFRPRTGSAAGCYLESLETFSGTGAAPSRETAAPTRVSSSDG